MSLNLISKYSVGADGRGRGRTEALAGPEQAVSVGPVTKPG